MRKVLVLGFVLLALLGAGAWWLLQRSHAVLDSAEVERIASRLLPGARPPAGLKGVLALQPEGLEVAIFAPDLGQARTEGIEPGGLRIIIARPNQPQPPDPLEVLSKIRQVRKEQAESLETLSKRPLLLNLGGRKQPAEESELKVKSSGRLLRQNFTVVLVEKHPVVLVITGGEPGFHQAARDEFLANLSPPAGPGLPALPGSPLPGNKPPLPGRPKPPVPPGWKPAARPPASPLGKPQPPRPPKISMPAAPRPKMPKPAPPRPPGPPAGPPEGPGGPPGGPPGFP